MGILSIYHPDIMEFIEAKSSDANRLNHFNVSVLVDDNFMRAVENDEMITLHYPIYDEYGNKLSSDKWAKEFNKEVKATEIWDSIMKMAYDNGEPGIFFEDTMQKNNPANYVENIICTNPCFTGDMKLLTENGYKRFDELEGNNNITIINNDGEKSYGNKVWCSGIKDTVKIKLSNGSFITCTPNHVFMLNDGSECEAKELLHKHLMPICEEKLLQDSNFIKLGFVQGDGNLTRLNSKHHSGVEVNIGEKDKDILNLFSKQEMTSTHYWKNCKDTLINLGFDSSPLPNRKLPSSYDSWSNIQKRSFLCGMFSANGSVVKKHRVQYKTTCKALAIQLQHVLKEFGIYTNITTNKPKKVKFSNGEYTCKESYDVCINQYESIKNFAKYIGFYHPYKTNSLKSLIIYRSPYVISIKPFKKQKVYDFTENKNHWGVVEGVIVHNCSEYLAGTIKKENEDPNEYGGACNLGSIFLHNFVEKPFTKEAYLDYDKLNDTIDIAVRMLDDIIDVNKFPDPIYENYQKNMRTIGLGYTGLADMLAMLGLKYNTREARDFVNDLFSTLTNLAYKCSIDLAKEKGAFNFCDPEKHANTLFAKEEIPLLKDNIAKHGIRNAKIFAVAPCGTISMTYGNNCSSGIEPIFSLSYDRKVKIGGQEEDNAKIVKMMDYAYYLYNSMVEKGERVDFAPEDIFVTALEIDVEDHIKMLATIAKHIDMSVSKTINVPTDYPYEKTKDIYMNCWKLGVKGCTIFRPNAIRQGILFTEDNKSKEETTELARGEWKRIAPDTIYFKRKIKIGCGKLALFIGWSEKEKAIQELYVKRTGAGGCEMNIQACVITMSGMLRLGGNIFNIEKAFEGLGACNSFVLQRAKGKQLSQGSSCATAILNEIKAFLKEQSVEVTPSQKVDTKPTIVASTTITSSLKCPECGAPMTMEGGCVICKSCGYSKCN